MNKELIEKNIKLTEETLKQLDEKEKLTHEEHDKIVEAISEGREINNFVLESFKKELEFC